MSKIEPGLKYTSDHEWIKVLDNGEALVGITDFAQGELGELVYIEVITVGKTLRQGDIFGTVEAVKTTSDLFIPVGGKVLEFNEAIGEKGDPSLINNDPYGAGWIIRMEVSNPEELEGLLIGDAYAALLH